VMFQSTHPRGVRLPPKNNRDWPPTGFNPRTREGCDCKDERILRKGSGFNPRTREGCDLIVSY